MPPNNYSEQEENMFDTFVEKALPPLFTYFVRKTLLGLILVNMFVLQIVSNRFGFDLTVEVSDRDCWKWEPYNKISKYPWVGWKKRE